MNIVDVSFALGAVASATGFLVWRARAGKAQPACHPAVNDDEAPVVVVGAGLARGLQRAQARNAARGLRQKQ